MLLPHRRCVCARWAAKRTRSALTAYAGTCRRLTAALMRTVLGLRLHTNASTCSTFSHQVAWGSVGGSALQVGRSDRSVFVFTVLNIAHLSMIADTSLHNSPHGCTEACAKPALEVQCQKYNATPAGIDAAAMLLWRGAQVAGSWAMESWHREPLCPQYLHRCVWSGNWICCVGLRK
jgi:hypothetical protein